MKARAFLYRRPPEIDEAVALLLGRSTKPE